jgi:hypothetical protein
MSNFDKLFGRTYSTVGNSDSDFIIKTRGQVKVQWGKKFIDIIKDGKLNVDAEVIKKVKTISSIVQDGIYFIEDTSSVILKVGNTLINLSSDTESSYVSFIIDQNTTEKQRLTAQSNIGLRYKSMSDATKAGILNGIVFLEDTQKWYIVNNGAYSVYAQEIPNPYTEQFRISKSDSSTGALYIEGIGISNSMVIGTTQNEGVLYKDSNTFVIDNSDAIEFRVNGENKLRIGEYNNTITSDTSFNGVLSSNKLQSIGASLSSGYRIYTEAGESFMETDNLLVRNGINSISISYSEFVEMLNDKSLTPFSTYIINDFQNEWELTIEEDTITEDVQASDEDETIPVIETYKNVRPLIVTAISSSEISGEVMYQDNPLWKLSYDPYYTNTFQVITSNGGISEVQAKGRITRLTDEKGNSCNYDFKHLRFKITEDGVDKWIYTFRNGEEDLSLTDTCRNNVLTVNNYEIKSETVTVRDNGNIVTLQGTLSDNNFGTINSNFNFSGTANKLNVSRTLENVTFKEDSTIDEVAIRSLTNVTFNESFSRTTFHSDINDVDFDTTVYALLYDNEKVKDVYYNNNTVSVICIPDIAVATSGIPAGTIVMYNGTSGIPAGTIVMYNGTSGIPAGWAICDGTEGTPNLTGNFIKASETAGETGEFIPASSGSSTETPITYYSLVFIMKLA